MCYFVYLCGKGIQFDGNGTRSTWMLQDDFKTLSEKYQCFVDMFDGIPVPGRPDLKVL